MSATGEMDGLKRCSICKEERHLYEFPATTHLKSGREARCKQCKADKDAVWRGRNPNYVSPCLIDKEYHRNWRENNPDKAREAQRRYKETHKEELREKARARNEKKRSADRDAWNAKRREYTKKHPEAIAVMHSRRRARKMAAEGDHTKEEAAALLEAQSWVCANAYCKADLHKTRKDLDHKTPLARGGGNGVSNLQWLCSGCNRRKHNKTMEEFIVWLDNLRCVAA